MSLVYAGPADAGDGSYAPTRLAVARNTVRERANGPELEIVKFPSQRGDLLAHPVALRVGSGGALPEPLVVVEDAGNDASEEVLAFLDPALHLLPRADRAGPRHVHPDASSSRVGRPRRRPRGFPTREEEASG